MSKLTKLMRNPREFLRDAKVFRLYRAAVSGSVAAPSPPPPKAPKKKSAPTKAHPLPTLNLAKETSLSALEERLEKANREYLRFRTSPDAHDRIVTTLSTRVRDFMLGIDFADRDYAGDVSDFLGSCESNPALGAARTTATGSLLWLYVFTKALAPKVVVESGVFKGASLYTLHSAAPDSEVYAYDIDLSNLVYSHSSIRYHEGDWSEAYPTAKGAGDLCYFDDHINNCLRVREAWDHGFRHLVFDDSPDIGELHKWRFPGVPTIQMVNNGTLLPDEWVEWTWKNRKLRYVYREEHTHGVKDLLDLVVELPSLSSLTGRPMGVQTYVRLKEK